MYDGPETTPISVLNEKALCGLGDRDLRTGALRDDAMDQALAILRRFKSLIDLMRPEKAIVFATAAVREASNGSSFLQAIGDLGLSPIILSGEEEARLAALGVLSAAPEILHRPKGALSGDIGGGSLELCHICADEEDFLGPRVSLPLGGLRLSSMFGSDYKAAHQHIEHTLDGVEWLKTDMTSAFYIVGGAWRTLGRLAILDNRYPLDMLDHFTLSRREVSGLIERVVKTPAHELEKSPVVQRRRAPTLPFAAMALDAIVNRLDADRIVISACGVREGVIYDRLSEDEKRIDPLTSLTRYFARTSRASIVPSAQRLWHFLAPAWSSVGIGNERLWKAAMRLSHTSLIHHPEIRAERSAVSAMGMPWRGLTHRERTMLASALYFRHGGRSSELYNFVPVSLMGEDDMLEARRVGLGLRFALELDPNGRAVLPRAELRVDGDTLSLRLTEPDRSFWGRSPEKRFSRFAAALSLTPVYR